MSLTKNQKIIVIVGLSAFILLSTYTPPEEAIAVIETTFIVTGLNGVGLVGARIECYQHGILGVPSAPSFTLTTEFGGIVKRIIAQGWYTIKVSAIGYQTETEVIDMRISNEPNPARTYPFDLIWDGSGPPPGVATTFYLEDSQYRRVSGFVSDMVNGAEATYVLTDNHGFGVLYLSQDSHSLRFHGWYQKDTSLWGSVEFDFTRTITVSSATTYTVYVETESIQNKLPDAENDNDTEGTLLTRIIKTLQGLFGTNWQMVTLLIVVAFILLLRR